MTALFEERTPTAAEREQSSLAQEIEHIRALLEAARDGGPSPAASATQDHAFEPAIDRLARLLGLSPFERRLLIP